MASPDRRRRLIVNADDFGASSSINEAVVNAHRAGILTSASLMVGGAAFEEAVEMARRHPTLGVGLHLVLVHGRPVLPAERLPGWVGSDGCFPTDAPRAGFRLWTRRDLLAPMESEVHAQWERFEATGLPMDHVNGHLHFHLHPTVFEVVRRLMTERGMRRVRLTRDSFRMSLGLQRGRWLYRVSHALIFAALSARARRRLGVGGDGGVDAVRSPDRVVGLLADGQMDEAYWMRMLPRLAGGVTEVYAHPSTDRFRHEYEALISPRVREAVRGLGFELVRYQDL